MTTQETPDPAAKTIFLSHSSKDRLILERLKQKLEEKARANLFFFLSSDGRSIPFGQNWAASIEDNLKSSDIFFAFISPNSIDNPWIYFETGFAAHNNIPVVPIAMSGIKMSDVPFPIALRQGFELYDTLSLRNIPRIINEYLGPDIIDEEFKKNEINEVFKGYVSSYPRFEPAFNSVYHIEMKFEARDSAKWNSSRIMIDLQTSLESENHDVGGDIHRLFGLGFSATPIDRGIEIKLNGTSARAWFPSMHHFCNDLITHTGPNGCDLTVMMELRTGDVNVCDIASIKGGLYGSGIKEAPQKPDSVELNECLIQLMPGFENEGQLSIIVESQLYQKPIECILEFLYILWDKKIITPKQHNGSV